MSTLQDQLNAALDLLGRTQKHLEGMTKYVDTANSQWEQIEKARARNPTDPELVAQAEFATQNRRKLMATAIEDQKQVAALQARIDDLKRQISAATRAAATPPATVQLNDGSSIIKANADGTSTITFSTPPPPPPPVKTTVPTPQPAPVGNPKVDSLKNGAALNPTTAPLMPAPRPSERANVGSDAAAKTMPKGKGGVSTAVLLLAAIAIGAIFFTRQ